MIFDNASGELLFCSRQMAFIYAPVNYSYNLSYDHCLAFVLLMKSRVIIYRSYLSFKACMMVIKKKKTTTQPKPPCNIFHNSWQLPCCYNCNILQELCYLIVEARKDFFSSTYSTQKCVLVFPLPLTAKAVQKIPAMWKTV